jgi:hypothetical protein
MSVQGFMTSKLVNNPSLKEKRSLLWQSAHEIGCFVTT